MLIRQISYCLAVQKYRSFTKAAEVCCVTQPTLSQQISSLEDYLGVRIFCRKTKPVGITHSGAILLEKAKEIDFLCKDFLVLSKHLSSGKK